MKVVSYLSRTLATQQDRAFLTNVQLNDVSGETSDDTCSFKSIESWNSRRNFLQKAPQNYGKHSAHRYQGDLLAKQDPHVVMDVHVAQDLYQRQRTIVPTNADSPSIALSEKGAIYRGEENLRYSPGSQPMLVQPQNAKSPLKRQQTSASIPLVKIAKWDGISRDIIQALITAFDAEDYPDCIRNLEAQGIKPLLYVNNLDKVYASPIPRPYFSFSPFVNRLSTSSQLIQIYENDPSKH